MPPPVNIQAYEKFNGLFQKMLFDNGISFVGDVINIRRRCTLAEINAGAITLLPPFLGASYRLIDAQMIAIGGAAAGATSVDLLATQGAASVKLMAAAVAGLTQDTLLRAGAANAAILANGLSFVKNDSNTAIQVSKTGAALTTVTNVDVILSFVYEPD